MMAEPAPSTTSYLDLEDPFNTTTSSQPSAKSKVSSQSSELSDGEISDDSGAEDAITRNKITAPSDDHFKAGDSFDDWHLPGPADHRRQSVREILEAPSEWNFSRLVQEEERKNRLSPDEIREKADKLLDQDVFNFSPKDLRTLVKIAAKLVSEHDLLLFNRNRLLETMDEMHTTERDTTMELLSQMPLDSIDEESRRIIYSMASKLGELGPCPSDEDLLGKCLDDNDVNVPRTSSSESSEFSSTDLMKILSVPPPDPTRPPPSFSPEGIVPDVCRSPCMSADMATPPPSLSACSPYSAPPCLPGNYGKFPSLVDPNILRPTVPVFSPPPCSLVRTQMRPAPFMFPRGRPFPMMPMNTVKFQGGHYTPHHQPPPPPLLPGYFSHKVAKGSWLSPNWTCGRRFPVSRGRGGYKKN